LRDNARKHGREIALIDREVAADGTPGDEIARAEETCLVRALVRRLSPVQQRVVVLHYGHNWSYRRVGEHMNKSEAAVKQIAYRALKNLRCWAQEAE
jgi:RNA polymerase sigma factor (sigma-70 family)